MNLQDHIVRILADGPMNFANLHAAVNNVTDPRHPWSVEWFTSQLELAVWRGHVIKDANGNFSLPPKDGA